MGNKAPSPRTIERNAEMTFRCDFSHRLDHQRTLNNRINESIDEEEEEKKRDDISLDCQIIFFKND